MKLKTLFILVLCNLIWSANPAMAKVLMGAGASPLLTAWLRYSSALVAYAAFSALACVRDRRLPCFMVPRGSSERFWILLIGVMVFFFAPLMQMSGLYSSHATENALIVAMEPLITVFLAWLILRDPISSLHLGAFAIALGGFALLGGLLDSVVGVEIESAHLIGNFLILLSLAGEACYSIAGRKLLMRHPPKAIFGSALLIGVLGLTVVLMIKEPGVFSRFTGWGPKVGLAILFLGPLGTSLTYIYWMFALNEASVASVALTLFVQPVFGSIWGAFFLNERLSLIQWAGAALIAAAVILAMRAPTYSPRSDLCGSAPDRLGG
jgi:drug/metabolite transporter (DMT)-like permease